MAGGGGNSFQRWLTCGSILVLLLTSVFHFYRGSPADGGVYLVLAVALILNGRQESTDAKVQRDRHSSSQFHPWWLIVLLPLLATVAALLPLGAWLVVLLLGTGAGIMILGWRIDPKAEAVSNPRMLGPQHRNTALGLCVVVLFLCFWELWMYFTKHLNPELESIYPPLTDLVEPAFQGMSTRWLLTLLWMTGCALLVVPHPRANGRNRI